MESISWYDSPLGRILLAAERDALTGLWFEGQKYFAAKLKESTEEENEPVMLAKRWLDEYFKGSKPETEVPIRFTGTEFQNEVWEILYSVPYGAVTTYGKIADVIQKRRGVSASLSRAVGSAVGRNRISLIVPCHRVIGSDNSLTGYAGGIEKKIELLKLEGTWKDEFKI